MRSSHCGPILESLEMQVDVNEVQSARAVYPKKSVRSSHATEPHSPPNNDSADLESRSCGSLKGDHVRN